jgi:hypothetical protein
LLTNYQKKDTLIIPKKKMVFLDRTEEFFNIVQKSRSDNIERKKEVKQNSFYSLSQKTSKELQETTDLLNKLINLIKKRGAFEQNSENITNLTRIIQEKLNDNKYEISNLEEQLKVQKENQYKKNSDTIISSLQSHFNYATDKFSDILKIRTISLKNEQKRIENFSGTPEKRGLFNKIIKSSNKNSNKK